ncbi:MAG: hypothetical protein EPN56_13440 [Rhodanobacter sp.]|nr:MAG: hypothetical protein EPN78_09445 [Rhodanobacter sp.]TAM12044.1 MAG: hypothetical protein EPN66_07430 [Rhodanobacter sp.]TAM34615.1 MAG: hypothetical protein EPN56_13440 [Rhodanobacter sp.]
MRSFDDTRGECWQAALLEASYGNIALVFSPMRGSEVRQTLMLAETLTEAQEQLAALDDAGLRRMLDEAQPWDGGNLT